jgi:sugar transferase (PEP-CTERM system associated)
VSEQSGRGSFRIRACHRPPSGIVDEARHHGRMIRVFRHYVPRSLILLGTSEALILFGSIYLGVSLRLRDFNPTSFLLVGDTWTKAVAYAVMMMLLMATVGLYQRGLRDDIRGLLFRVGVAFFLGLVIMGTVYTLAPQYSIGRTALTLASVFSATCIAFFRLAVYKYSDNTIFNRRILVLGSGELAAQIEKLRRRSDWHDIELIGYVQMPGEDPVVDPNRVITLNSTLYELARSQEADEIVVAIGDRRRHFPINDILDCKMRGIQIIDMLGFFERQTGRITIDALSPSSMVFADGFIQAVIKTYTHRLFDLAIALFVLLLTWPIMLVTALMIWFESGLRGPIFYRQTRVGRDGRLFQILKFRSMSVDAESGGTARWATQDDARITHVGEFIRKMRIDELPQIFNVLKGEMSFVGPRPERPEFVEELVKEIPFYDLRHRVNPGITGWAQICYPYGASREDAKDKLEYDLYYIKNFSLFLDLMILIQTAQVILWGKGAR